MSPSPDTATGVRPARPLPLLVGLLAFAAAAAGFAATALVGALQVLIVHFRTDLDNAGWAVNAFILVAAASAVVGGRVGDRYGRRRLLVALLLVSTVGAAISLATDTLSGVIAGQAVAGVAGGVLPLCFGLAREALPWQKVPVATAVIAGAATLGGATGAVVAEAMVQSPGWRYLLVVTGAATLLAGLACILLPGSARVGGGERVNWLAGVVLVAAVSLVLFGVQGSITRSWSDGRTIAGIVCGLALLALWAAWERRVEHPMINVRLLTGRKTVLTTLATAVLVTGIVGAAGLLLQTLMQTPELAPVGIGLSARETVWLLFGVAALGLLLSPVAGWLAARAGARQSLVVGSLFGVVNALCLALFHDSVTGVVVSVAFLAVATSFVLSAIPILIMEDTPEENTSEATGLNVVVRTVFTTLGTSLATYFLSHNLVPRTPFSSSDAFSQGFTLIGACSAAGFVLALFIRSGERSGAAAPSAALATKA
ncbi:MFS transporter [Streptomyces cylindrosporus]|uniref:MFS transporter n=1 Tax=Streptomyces cylindrosporus TaxID=2927583 RepID=A0ABS9Y8V8_9ACTN|nr:MFS transporter [Streptomyces cylindrosporus]MCI3273665.1 MFS transporter [Streptomyces cylindrosporus]